MIWAYFYTEIVKAEYWLDNAWKGDPDPGVCERGGGGGDKKR